MYTYRNRVLNTPGTSYMTMINRKQRAIFTTIPTLVELASLLIASTT